LDYNEIVLPDSYRPLGRLFQGGTADASVATLPGPLEIVCMDLGELNESLIDHKNVECLLAVWINDSPDAVLKDQTLLLLTRQVRSWLQAGGNVLVHCGAGVSRASYMDCALLMSTFKVSFDSALEIIRRSRPQANPNSGFVDQLRRMEPAIQNL
jgi:hypothetical protein